MVREGLFNDVDIVLHWHPDDTNSANLRTSNSNKSAKFTFTGISAMLQVLLNKEDQLLMELSQ